MEKTVIELFAGVGGFRIGLNDIKKINKKGLAVEKNNFKFVWANQWEPSTSKQYAYECYKKRFNSSDDELSNLNISLVNKKSIPNHSLLCGGFPCQDYSVARSLSNEKGIEGKKGVLWWDIVDILKAKKTPFILLENVDRLLKSPSKQKGRDFGIMLRCLDDLGYVVEWRVINAADYGFPQRRRRIYIFAYKKTTEHYKKTKKICAENIIKKQGVFASSFPVENFDRKIEPILLKEKYKTLLDVSNDFSECFENSGYMINGKIYTYKVTPIFVSPIKLEQIVQCEPIDSHFYLDNVKKEKFKYLRGSKKIPRTSKLGIKYLYSEGAMSPTDSLQLPGRTMLTSEGTLNRSTHIIDDPCTGKRRILTPVECERLNQFPDNWTCVLPERKRYFVMGNALVTGIIKKIGYIVSKIIENEN